MDKDSAEFKALIKSRGNVKGRLTRFRTFLDGVPESKVNYVELKIRLEKVEAAFSDFESVQEEIEVVESEEEANKERQQFEDDYFSLVARAKDLLGSSSLHSADNPSVGSGQSVITQNFVQLPKIKLPTFDGNCEEYRSFMGTFTSLIDDRSDLNPIQKFHYLKSALTKEALEVIASLEISNQNYKVALELIKQRFDNKKLVVNRHINAVVNYPKLGKESSAIHLRKLLDNTLKHLRALKSLGEPTDSWDSLVIFIVTNKLDSESQRLWEEAGSREEMPSMSELTNFLQTRCHVLESLEPDMTFRQLKPRSQPPVYVASNNRYRTQAGNFLVRSQPAQPSCCICGDKHKIYYCRTFLGLSVHDRIRRVKQSGLCFNCLNTTEHKVENCSSGSCKECNKKHNTLLHIVPEMQPTTSSELPVKNKNSSQEISIALHQTQSPRQRSTVLLATAVVYVLDAAGEKQLYRVLLDSGSQSNFVSERMARLLRIPQYKVDCTVNGITGAKVNTGRALQCTVKSRFSSYSLELEFLILNKLTFPLPTVSFDTTNWNIPSHIELADPQFNQPQAVDMFIGAQVFFEMLCAGRLQLGPNLPILQNTNLGWVISGRLLFASERKGPSEESICCASIMESIALEEIIEKFWLLEDSSQNHTRTPEEQRCEKLFIQTVQRDSSGRFIVQLPFNDNINGLGDSKGIATKRFLHLEKRLLKNPSLQKEYQQFMSDYRNLGHMEQVPENSKDCDNAYYLPHHAVRNESSSTTKLRVVFDASCKTSSGLSLNDALMTGPTVQDDLFSIILRFRTHRFVMTADIQKMFRQIKVDPSHTDFQRIIWRDHTNEPLKTYRLLTVTYGTAAAPYLAARCLLQVAHDVRAENPKLSSERAYGACVYIRCEDKVGAVNTRLLTAKSRVAPLRKVTLPRLELCAAVLAAQLLKRVTDGLQLQGVICTLWTDSTIVLAWIQSPSSQWKTFVANRVAEIHELTVNYKWRHVNTESNPADYVSRGVTPSELLSLEAWWHGPSWLELQPENWPKLAKPSEHQQGTEETSERRTATLALASTEQPSLISIHRYSSYLKLLRVTAYCKRFLKNIRLPHDKRNKEASVSASELQEALGLLVRQVGKAYLTWEEMYTFLNSIEACLNSRPITPLSSDPNDLSPLTPGHFLIGEPLTAPPEPDIRDLKVNRLSRWQRVRQLTQRFWSRWWKEYLASLQQRKIWRHLPRLEVGELVLLKEENLPPLRWRLTRIQGLHPGPDGLVRVVTVRTREGTFRRAVGSLCPLPSEQEESSPQ